MIYYSLIHNGTPVYGELHGDFLYTNSGVVGINDTLQRHEVPAISLQVPIIFHTAEPSNAYEAAQLEKHGNFVKQQGDDGDYDEWKNQFYDTKNTL